MSDAPSPPTSSSIEPTDVSQFEKIQGIVSLEFEVTESMIEHGIPTFSVVLRGDSKKAFSRLYATLRSNGFTPVLRERNGANVLKVLPKTKTRPSRPIVNVALLLLTIATVFTTGYILSEGVDPWIGASSFTLALLGILGVHEMAHKFAADHHNMEATMPYFIPGPPPIPGLLLGIGTFGAVIVQKETAPNRDALFDIGASGPIAGFVLTVIVSAIGLAFSRVEPMTEPISGGLPISPLFLFLIDAIVGPRAPGPGNFVVYLHPVAFAGWIGMFVTLLNLLPTGMLDGGHTLRSVINNDRLRAIFSLISIIILLFTGQFLMLAFVLFLSMYRHPGPLDDVSKLSLSRKLVAMLLVFVFVLCLFIF